MSRIESSLLIAAKDSKSLAHFYSGLTNSQINRGLSENHFYLTTEGGCRIQFYEPSSKRKWPSRGRVISICFERYVDCDPYLALQEWIKELKLSGGFVDEQPRMEHFGAEAWLRDPEGNQFLILILQKNN